MCDSVQTQSVKTKIAPKSDIGTSSRASKPPSTRKRALRPHSRRSYSINPDLAGARSCLSPAPLYPTCDSAGSSNAVRCLPSGSADRNPAACVVTQSLRRHPHSVSIQSCKAIFVPIALNRAADTDCGTALALLKGRRHRPSRKSAVPLWSPRRQQALSGIHHPLPAKPWKRSNRGGFT